MTMRKENKEELRSLSRRLNAKGTTTNFRSLEQIGRYRQLSEEARQGPTLDDALMEQSMFLIGQGRLCEALLSFELRLQKAPLVLSAVRGWRHVRHTVLEEMQKLMEVDPECAEFGRTYEKLVDIGYVSNPLHLGAVRHYLASGQIEKAGQILLAIVKVMPGAPGVAELVILLAEVSDNVEVQKLSIMMKEEE